MLNWILIELLKIDFNTWSENTHSTKAHYSTTCVQLSKEQLAEKLMLRVKEVPLRNPAEDHNQAHCNQQSHP